MKKTIFLILCILCSLGAMAQKKSITGVVTDASGESVIGASVVEVGTTNGVITDIDGKFTLSVDPNGKIRVSYIGYQPQVLDVKGKNSFNIKLKEDSEMLEEVVVTGYGGKQLRTKVTNSIAKVKDEALKVGLFSNPAQALSGAVAGLKVTQASGSPGAAPKVTLRGGTNFDGSGDPLVIVDGQLRDGMQDINPEDIESMEVLKDAGATAIYGARASNGVILITTKTGKEGRREINFKAKMGLSYVNNPYDFLGAKDYINVLRTGYSKSGFTTSDGEYVSIAPLGNLTSASPFGTGNTLNDKTIWNIMNKTADNAYLLQKGWQEMPDPLDPSKTILYKDTNPADYNLNNPAISQDYNINMSGGNDKGTYYAGLGYNRQEGLPIKTFYERYSFVLNASYKITDWLTSSSNFNYNRANWKNMPGSQTSEGNYFGRIMSTPPTVRFQDEDGNPTLGPVAGDGNQNYQPDKWWNFNQSDKFTMVQAFQIDILKNLSVKGTANWYYSESLAESFTRDYENTPGQFVRTRSSSASFSRNFSQTYNVVLNYNQTFAKDHNVAVMLGMEYFDRYSRSFSASGSGAPTDDFADLSLTDNGEGKRSIDSGHSDYRILSYFGRLNYDYKGRYLLSAVFRQDGYSSLLGNNRWGFFPGVSAGWIFGQENFVKNALPFLSFGKLRASYGVNGNATGIGAYDLQGSYNSQKYNGNVGFLIGALPNPGLKWEKTRTAEVGIDMSFFENRLNANFTYYNRLTSDKYANLSLPSTTGFSSIKNNNGKFRNSGVEIELSGKILKTKDWSWDLGGNISFNKNKIVSLPDNGLIRNQQDAAQIYSGRQLSDGTYEKIWVGGNQEGYEPGVLIAYKADGLYRSWDEIPGDLVVTSGNYFGKKMYGPEAWKKLSAAEQKNALPIQPGDVKWRDINGDGMIDNYDQVVVGNTNPHWIGGFNTTLRWKNFQLYGRFDFAFDYWIYDNTTPWFLGCMQGTYNTTKDVFNTWSEENPNAKYPRFVYADQLMNANYYRTSTLFAYKGNYLAIREISLSYSLPKAWANKAYCQKVDVSITGQNLGYITSANVASPEVSSAGSGYALPRTLLFGLNVTF
ncbi:SusC/RagA family TonB-linked outer membrane protein [Bacteroides fragilis]|jgi:TonB-linked SusC/RagA family outer membrane protein|uniref:SusC/RagA family TonB-linked outer membrane protein n=3 Tax=Bacteroides fragilis TaxID=817 RepID=UPI0006A66720|nr:TonB-dependent receptor [Bacteroides fragilis]KAA4785394.1 TonB-dependent receptor [Bacteroides fragilis]MCA5596624.1 TonB-dependent receptor [Bacteroides fragilis]MCS2790294.1 TonB-dependent receptor [Bacteroides fragilis]MCZ2593173.1 TonB-dependent receptor [Bacteroides fragilis]CUA18230.1 TonB dependent receptor [Bacteroides fragilis]